MEEETRTLLASLNTRIRKKKCSIITLGCVLGAIVLFIFFLRFSTSWILTLQLSGLVSSFIGACFFAIGAIPSLKTIIEFSKTKWDINVDIMDSLIINRLSAIIGIMFVGVGYILLGVGICISIWNNY